MVRDLQALAWLEDDTTTEIDLGHDAFGVITLESALDEFCAILGQRVHDHWGSGGAAGTAGWRMSASLHHSFEHQPTHSHLSTFYMSQLTPLRANQHHLIYEQMYMTRLWGAGDGRVR